jgi:CRP-like cAMP-binding protein
VTRRTEQVRAFLAASEVFGGLGATDLEQLASITRSKKITRASAVFWKGEAATQLYAVFSGHLKVVAPSADGREVVLRLLDPGVFFGEIALLDGGTRTASVVASEASELLVIDRRELLDLLRRRPLIGIEMLAVLARRLRATTEQVEETTFLTLPPRLARKLLELADRYGRPEGGGVKIERGLSQEELGTLVGTSRVSINQQLKAWESQGFVSVARGSITLLDAAALQSVAEG